MRLSLRSILALLPALAALAASAPASAQAVDGFTVYKDFRTHAVVEFRDAYTGRVLESRKEKPVKPDKHSACGDKHTEKVGARWDGFQPYLVNRDSAPSYLDAGQALADVLAGHDAWTGSFVTDCANAPGPTSYTTVYGGTTDLDPSLGWLEFDGVNSVGFLPLTGTVCDAPGVVACVIAASDKKRFVEADMLVEADLASRIGPGFRWTTGDTTWWTPGVGEIAVVDVVTHEWGHFAGLGHVNGSPELTMYPSIHDGMQTLGLGDMQGLLKLYPAPKGKGKG